MPPLFREYLNPQVIRINKMVNSVNTILVFQDQLQGYILLYFYNFLRALSLFRMLVEFSLIFVLFHHVWEKFSIYGVHIPRKSIESALLPQSKLSPQFLSSHPRQREITHSLRQYFFKNLFPPTAERSVGNYDLLFWNSIRKCEDDLKH